jgi:S1-C subfamily serine protease
VIFTQQGHVLTNNHVVANAIEVEVTLSDRRTVSATVVGTDPDADLAVLKLDPDAITELPVAQLGDTDAMAIGDWVIAIGSPLGFEGSVTVGVVSAKNRSIDLPGGVRLYDLLQTDAVINPGNSGGPLLNLAGEVIGINTAIIEEAEGIGFSISMGTAIPVSRQLIENGKVVRPRFGVSILDVTPEDADRLDLAVGEGILIVSVAPDGPSAVAGLEANDVIVQLDDRPVSSTTDLVRAILTDYEIGDIVAVMIARGMTTLVLHVTLGAP